jgi:hypothetical protein
MKKPAASVIRSTVPLTQRPERGADPLAGHCNVCGLPADPVLLQAWREHDERDLPIHGPDALVYLDSSHKDRKKILDDHPRLYAEDAGTPGAFPKICGPCVNRRGLGCAHPDLRANGGDGLRVQISDPFRGAILCGRHGQIRPVKHAFGCDGLKTKEEGP